ncbi:MAG: 1-acyl-sn-glycerol-3-phosphate acyltransferase [Rectinema subterraneum]|jgi:glycerol-3-phosphate O-acyltransferase
MDTIKSKYAHLIGEIIAHVPKNAHVSEENVYQQGIAALLPYIDTIIHDYIDDCSDIEGIENLASLHAHAKRGESCLMLMEHYSNFDLPVFHYLLRRSGQKGEEIASDIVAIAGIKLNEENPAVHAFARAYSRIVIYPSRSMQIIKEKYKDPKELYQEIKRSISINHAAMKALSAAKESGKLILVFPAGTRYRPWDPSSKRGVREIASYIKSFSKFCLVSVNGNILRINPSGDMEDDILQKDRVIYNVSPVHDSKEFLASVKYDLHFRDDKKQAIVDTIMDLLDAMHKETEDRCKG